MSIAQSLIPEFDQEMANTRKTLERLPDDKLEFKPDPKSMALGRLAGHIAEMVGWGNATLTTDSLDFAPGGKPSFEPMVATSREQVLRELDKAIAATRKSLETCPDEKMLAEWKLLQNGQTIMAMPRIATIRSMILNHIIHHRAQLTVYYRMLGVPVPALYGPSADEGMFGAAA
jgi:uncharacterized damage-inducible protein DinB